MPEPTPEEVQEDASRHLAIMAEQVGNERIENRKLQARVAELEEAAHDVVVHSSYYQGAGDSSAWLVKPEYHSRLAHILAFPPNGASALAKFHEAKLLRDEYWNEMWSLRDVLREAYGEKDAALAENRRLRELLEKAEPHISRSMTNPRNNDDWYDRGKRLRAEIDAALNASPADDSTTNRVESRAKRDEAAGQPKRGVKAGIKPLPDYIEVRSTRCHAGSDGDCVWAECPQLANYQNHCPLDVGPAEAE